MFVGRERELQILEQLHASEKAELFVLYGRRRFGKTELLTTPHELARERPEILLFSLQEILDRCQMGRESRITQ